MKLIVGLGNPGPKYAWTRHNLGFMVVATLAGELGVSLRTDTMKAQWGQGRVGEETVILAQPTTYMNLSGEAVGRLLRYWRLALQEVIVIHDDLDVPLGRLKIATRGGAGGHRGVMSIIAVLGSEEFCRVKLGIGRPPTGMASEDFVLSPFLPEEEEVMASLVERGAEAVLTLVKEGLAAAQNRFHRSPEI